MKMSEILSFLDNSDACEFTYRGRKVRYIDEAGTPSDRSRFYAAGFEHGAHVIVHVETYHSEDFKAAWEAWVDSLPTIPEDELIEAYSPGRDKGSFLDEAHREARADGDAPTVHPPFSEAWHTHIARIREAAKAALDAAAEKANEGLAEYPELVEGYEMQSNCSGTGIVSLGHYAWMHEADLDELEISVKETETV